MRHMNIYISGYKSTPESQYPRDPRHPSDNVDVFYSAKPDWQMDHRDQATRELTMLNAMRPHKDAHYCTLEIEELEAESSRSCAPATRNHLPRNNREYSCPWVLTHMPTPTKPTTDLPTIIENTGHALTASELGDLLRLAAQLSTK